MLPKMYKDKNIRGSMNNENSSDEDGAEAG